MIYAAQDVVRGAAVVIDDKIEEPDTDLRAILDQLSSAAVPTIKLKDLPNIESLIHWKRFGLIVLDWELSYAAAEGGIDVPAGVTVPSELESESHKRILAFVEALLDQTSLPIFVATNASVDGIETELADHFSDRARTVRDRVKVFSKGNLETSLFTHIGRWIDSKPALMALRAWGRSYTDAEIAVFNQFAEQEEDWVHSVARAAIADGTSFEVALLELLSRNIVNRVGPLNLNLEIREEGTPADASALRHVLHLSAVIPAQALDGGEFRTGDMFVLEDAEEPYGEIKIVITPDCDLARIDNFRLTYVRAMRKVSTRESAKKRADDVGRPERLHLTNTLLTRTGNEYDISLKDWDVAKVSLRKKGPDRISWRSHRRIGRLLDPYITEIQQSVALTSIRRGLPRLPDDFYEGWKPDL